MGLSIKHHASSGLRCRHLSPSLSADWPVRVFYGLVTLYQGLFGIFVPTSIFHQAMHDYGGAVVIITCLLLVGALLVVDGLFSMIRYCTRMSCDRVRPAMVAFNRWRPLLFLPPVFCYYLTLIMVSRQMQTGVLTVTGYYVTLAVLGVVFCLRDGIISQSAQRRGPHA